MAVTKTQLADAYVQALNAELGNKWDYQFKRRDAKDFVDILCDVAAELALKDTTKTRPGSVPLGSLGRIKMRYKKATKRRKGVNPFTGEPTTFKAKPATLQPRFTAAKVLKDQAAKYAKKKWK